MKGCVSVRPTTRDFYPDFIIFPIISSIFKVSKALFEDVTGIFF